MASEEDFRTLRKLIESYEWRLERIRGSHHVFTKAGETPLVLPVHRERVKPAYVRLVRKRLGLA